MINAWLGQSTAVAEKHYLQVTDEHWGRAVEFRPLAGPLITNGAESIASNHETKKPLENMAGDVYQGFAMDVLVTPMGIEPMLPP